MKKRGMIEPALIGFLSLIFVLMLYPMLSSIIGPMVFDDPAIGFIFHSISFLIIIIVVAYIIWSLGNSARGGGS